VFESFMTVRMGVSVGRLPQEVLLEEFYMSCCSETLMMEAVRTPETSVDNHFTRQYNPEDSSEHHTRRRENLKSHTCYSATMLYKPIYVS
jgi:hypothetical protein